MGRYVWLIVLASIAQACSAVPTSPAYRALYSHLETARQAAPPADASLVHSPCFIVFLVDARHLDYTDNRSFFKTVAKHPSDGCKHGDVGHSWIYLQGEVDGQTVFIEGGHTGETGCRQAPYFDGIMNYLDYGYASPTAEQRALPRYEPNPIKYLWETQRDGFFQWGAGNHRPTFAARVELSHDSFLRILAFVQRYNYSAYALTGNQCSSFMAQVASLAGLELECEVTMQIAPQVHVGGRCMRLWEDPGYAQLTIATPDILEKSLMQAVRHGYATDAMAWYRRTHRRPFHEALAEFKTDLLLFPRRLARYCEL